MPRNQKMRSNVAFVEDGVPDYGRIPVVRSGGSDQEEVNSTKALVGGVEVILADRSFTHFDPPEFIGDALVSARAIRHGDEWCLARISPQYIRSSGIVCMTHWAPAW